MDKITWGIIGVGDVCEVKSGPGFQKASNSELKWVMRRNGEKAQDFATRHNVPNATNDAEDLLNDPEIDAIYIATPPDYHLEYTQRSLAAGKHVYVEKPMARSGAEARQMLELAEGSKQKVVVAHYRRRLPLFMRIDELLKSGELGKPRHVSIQTIQPEQDPLIASSEVNWRMQPDVSGGGIFHDLAPHQLDLILQYFGPPEVIQGFSIMRNSDGSCDDCVSGQMRFRDDVLFQGHWDFASADGTIKDNCKIMCDNGTIRFSFFRSPTLVVKTNNGIETSNYEPPQHIQQPMIEAVNDYFLGNGENPCSAATGVQVMEMIDGFVSRK